MRKQNLIKKSVSESEATSLRWKFRKSKMSDASFLEELKCPITLEWLEDPISRCGTLSAVCCSVCLWRRTSGGQRFARRGREGVTGGQPLGSFHGWDWAQIPFE
jgi:hypothetical protein